MNDLRQAAQQALEALLRVKNHAWDEDTHEGRALITALKAALAEQQEPQVPVGWLESPHGAFRPNFELKTNFTDSLEWRIPVYWQAPVQEPVAHRITGEKT